MHIIIIGCGELGFRLAQELSGGKDNVVVIDRNREALVRLGARFNGVIITGNALNLEALEKSGMKSADAVFVLTGNEPLNLVIGQVAQKMFKVKKIVIQLQSIAKQEAFARKGLIIINKNNLFLEKFKECIS